MVYFIHKSIRLCLVVFSFFFIFSAMFLQTVYGVPCMIGESNPTLQRELSIYGDVLVNVSWNDLASENCTLAVVSYFSDYPASEIDIYAYADKYYILWMGKLPPMPCTGQRIGTRNISGIIQLSKYCKISKRLDNTVFEVITPSLFFDVATMTDENEDFEYPAILQSNGQKIIYFAYNIGETPGILKCLLEGIESGSVENKRLEMQSAQENSGIIAETIKQNMTAHNSYPTKIWTPGDILIFVCILIVLVFGGYLLWKC